MTRKYKEIEKAVSDALHTVFNKKYLSYELVRDIMKLVMEYGEGKYSEGFDNGEEHALENIDWSDYAPDYSWRD